MTTVSHLRVFWHDSQTLLMHGSGKPVKQPAGCHAGKLCGGKVRGFSTASDASLAFLLLGKPREPCTSNVRWFLSTYGGRCILAAAARRAESQSAGLWAEFGAL